MNTYKRIYLQYRAIIINLTGINMRKPQKTSIYMVFKRMLRYQAAKSSKDTLRDFESENFEL